MNSKELSQSNGNEELFVIIRDDVTDWIIQNGLSKTESKLFFYFLRIDRFGDRPVKLKVAEILLATGIGKTAYHAAIAKFEALGWFDFKHTDVTISNNAGLSSSEKRTKKSESRTKKSENRTLEPKKRTEKSESRKITPPEPAPSKASEVPHTIQTNSDLKNTTEAANCCVLEKFKDKLHFYQVYLEIYDQASNSVVPNPKIATIRKIIQGMPAERAERAIAAFLAWLPNSKNIRCKYAAFATSLRQNWESS